MKITLSRKIGTDIHPVYTSRKIGSEINGKRREAPYRESAMRSIPFFFYCNVGDADYVSFACQHFDQLIEERKGSLIGSHVREQHGREPSDMNWDTGSCEKARVNFTV